jgi:hypothetical protein
MFSFILKANGSAFLRKKLFHYEMSEKERERVKKGSLTDKTCMFDKKEKN